jgi:hypothetical protein
MDEQALWLGLVDAAVDSAVRRGVDGTTNYPAVLDAAGKLARMARKESPPSFIATLAERFGLTACDELALWTLIAHQVRPATVARVTSLSGGDINLGALALVAYGGVTAAALASLSGQHSLIASGLVESIPSDRQQTWAQRIVRIPDRVLRIAVGRELDLADVACEAVFPDDALELGASILVREVSELVVGETTITRLRELLSTDAALVIATGIPGVGRRTSLIAVAAERGLRVLAFDARRFDKHRERCQRQIREVARECILGGRVPLLANLDALIDESNERLEIIGKELDARIRGTVLATCSTRTPTLRWNRSVYQVQLDRPTHAQRKAQWAAVLGSRVDADDLARRYPLAPALVSRIGDGLVANVELDVGMALPLAVRNVVDAGLHALATRVRVTQTWSDLVLDEDQANAVLELRARIRGRTRVYEDWGFGNKVGKGLGIAALFSGPPGTGKTMVAALIAQELEIDLFQVDLGKVVSKYIGETEKNLAALFDAAEASCSIILFDEADSMFGKRTEVKSSNDRYANLETNYLLQRLETYTGVCLLTSNHEGNIDAAFMRRLAMHIRFHMPDAHERGLLWKAMLPSRAPIASNVDFAHLAARYEMTGGYIRNAAVRAAFIASETTGEITHAILDRAARLEYEAMGKIVAQ